MGSREDVVRGRDEGDWLEFVAELLREPLTELPVRRIAEKVKEIFDAFAVVENAPDRSGVLHDEPWPIDAELVDGDRDDVREWRASSSVATHPILRHHGGAGDVRTGRVAELDRRHVGSRWEDGGARPARDLGGLEQLCIPIGGGGARPRTLVVGRATPFTAQELRMAALLGELLTGLDQQARAYSCALRAVMAGVDRVATSVELTPRERGVITLLAEGRTAGAIARRLGIAERTVHKHLERCYSKLGVADRLSAVLAAQRLGLVSG
jgi:DNA-binding CsgD family transcriptional regulator